VRSFGIAKLRRMLPVAEIIRILQMEAKIAIKSQTARSGIFDSLAFL